MHPLPHRYTVSFNATPAGDVEMAGEALATIHTSTPVEFGGLAIAGRRRRCSWAPWGTVWP